MSPYRRGVDANRKELDRLVLRISKRSVKRDANRKELDRLVLRISKCSVKRNALAWYKWLRISSFWLTQIELVSIVRIDASKMTEGIALDRSSTLGTLKASVYPGCLR